MLIVASTKWATTEHQQLWSLNLEKSNRYPAKLTNNWTISRHSTQQCFPQHGYHVLKMNINWASMNVGLASWIMWGLCGDINQLSNYQPPFEAKMLPTTSLLYPKSERHRSMKDCWSYIMETARGVRWHWAIFEWSATFLGKNACNDIATTSWTWPSPKRKRFLPFHHGKC